MLQTIAIMGPPRVSVPLTQAVTAPLLGRMEARGRGTVAAGAGRRSRSARSRTRRRSSSTSSSSSGSTRTPAATTSCSAWLPFVPEGQTGALVSAAIGARRVGGRGEHRPGARLPPRAAALAGRRAGARRPSRTSRAATGAARCPSGARFDPRAVVLAAVVAFAILLTGTWWPMLARGRACGSRSRGRCRAATGASSSPASSSPRSSSLGHARLRAHRRDRARDHAAAHGPRRAARPRRHVAAATPPGRRGCARSSGAALRRLRPDPRRARDRGGARRARLDRPRSSRRAGG